MKGGEHIDDDDDDDDDDTDNVLEVEDKTVTNLKLASTDLIDFFFKFSPSTCLVCCYNLKMFDLFLVSNDLLFSILVICYAV